MKNGKATSMPSMGGMNRANNMSSPAMGGRNLSKSPMHPVSAPSMGVSDGYDHAQDIKDAEGLPVGSVHSAHEKAQVKDAKSTHGSKQTDTAREMWREGVHSGHDAHGDAATPAKYTGHDSLHKENPGVQTKARADHFRRIGGGANAHGENAVTKQHNNQ